MWSSSPPPPLASKSPNIRRATTVHFQVLLLDVDAFHFVNVISIHKNNMNDTFWFIEIIENSIVWRNINFINAKVFHIDINAMQFVKFYLKQTVVNFLTATDLEMRVRNRWQKDRSALQFYKSFIRQNVCLY